MKTKKLSSLFVLIAGPCALLVSTAHATPVVDRKIEAAARSSYNYRTVLDGVVTVSAQDGVVTLTGIVDDSEDRDLAADTVSNLPGVTGVDNQIKIASKYPEHSDAWVAFKIRCRLLVKANVSAVNTKVFVTDGNVVLTGTADNLAQKELTTAYAKDIDGVKTVDNQIVINDKIPTSYAGETIDDASIDSEVKYALLDHKATRVVKTKIVTTDGVVRITGDASSDAEKALVTKLASDVRGVKSVTNDMTVQPMKN